MKYLLQPEVELPSDRWWATLATLTFVVLFSFLLVVMFRSTHKVRSFAFKQQNQIRVSLISPPKPLKQQRTKPSPVSPQPKAVERVEEEPIPVADIASLFSEVKTEQIQRSKKTAEQRRNEQKRMLLLQSRLKKLEQKPATNQNSSIAPLKLVTPATVTGEVPDSGGEAVDEYYARIQTLIYQNFFPPQRSEGAVAIVRIVLAPDGRLLDYRVLKRSGEPFFDREVDALQKRLKTVHFSENPKGRKSILDIRLISKE